MAAVRESYLFRIATDTIGRIWSGVGNLDIPAEAVEPAGARYKGVGGMLNAPDFQQLINGTAERVEFTVSGVDAETLRLALEDATSVPGAIVHLGRIDFDADWQQVGPVEWEAMFRADFLNVNRQNNGRPTRNITLSVGTDDTGRSHAPSSFFTDADQRAKSPTDNVFANVGRINVGTSRRFGPAGAQ